MNTLKQMGIQQWRLKPEFRSEFAPDNSARKADSLPGAEQIVSQSAAMPQEPQATQLINPVESAASALEETLVQPASVGVRAELSSLDWRGLEEYVKSYANCPSCGPTNSVLGNGNLNADCVFVLDAPSVAEIEQGQLLLGRAGKLFDAMLKAIDLDREQIYLSSVFKCAATDELNASPECDALVFRQLQLLNPKVVITFGEFAAQKVIKANEPLAQLRGSPQQCFLTNVCIVPTYSPTEMLNDPGLKAKVWQDLKLAMAVLRS